MLRNCVTGLCANRIHYYTLKAQAAGYPLTDLFKAID